MYVKVIRYHLLEEENRVYDTTTTVYECKRVTARLANTANDLVVEMEEPLVCLQYERKNLSVYIMNDKGDTIDSYVYGSKLS